MQKYLLNIYIEIEAKDDPEARKIAKDILEYDVYSLFKKVSLKQIKEGQEPRVIQFKPCLD